MKSEGTKGRERVVGKAAGDEYVFIPGEGPGWQIRSGVTMPDAAGGEGVTGWLNRKGQSTPSQLPLPTKFSSPSPLARGN